MKYFILCAWLMLACLCPAQKGHTPKVRLQSVTVAPASASIAVSGSQQFTATANYSNGTHAVVTSSSAWSSANTSAATVGSSTGLATGVSVGMATINATYSGKSASAGLTVTSTTCNPHSVSLSWTDSDPVTFNLYRSGTNVGPYSSIAIGLSSTSDIDTNTPAGTYYYVVTAVDGTGMESAYSAQASAVVPCQ